MNKVNYLILSSTIDFSTDLIALELQQQKKHYLRLNRDSFSGYEICYDLFSGKISIIIDSEEYIIEEKELKAVYFRAPVFLRSHKTYSLEEQLYRSQWSAFIRNLIIFENCRWVNHPVVTYAAENKMYQLKLAQQEGLCVPKTYVANSLNKIKIENDYIVKSLDTALFYSDKEEYFTYSNIVSYTDLSKANIADAPIIIQENLKNKIDIRVTVVGSKVFPVQIMKQGVGISGDWRKTPKNELEYIPFSLPKGIELKIINLMRRLKLAFGGMDLIYANDTFYFIEVNPTGEWGWLNFTSPFAIDKAIVEYMICST